MENPSGNCGQEDESVGTNWKRRRFALAASAIGVACAVAVAVSIWPRVSSVTSASQVLVPETGTTYEDYTIERGGAVNRVHVPVSNQAVKPVWEAKAYDVEGYHRAVLRTGAIAAFCVFFFAYAFAVLAFWAYDRVTRSRPTRETAGNDRRMRDLVKIVAGVVVGYVAASDAGTDLEKAQLKADVQAMQSTINNLQVSTKRLAEGSIPRHSVDQVVRAVCDAMGARVRSQADAATEPPSFSPTAPAAVPEK
jgi:hypothetical protein